mmetsp:Transcript_121481/g.340205  ORF Transcript_121481/g.340205 Transcript_121481/m.340205 type:complete len:483 (-) Transcript_121481:167-1615(-)
MDSLESLGELGDLASLLRVGKLSGAAFAPAARPGLPAPVFAPDGIQEGLRSVNSEDNPHWNDVLTVSADGSYFRHDGMDFMIDNDPGATFGDVTTETSSSGCYCCFMKCCSSSRSSEGRLSTTTTWRSADGAHVIKMVHRDTVDPVIKDEVRACCVRCQPISPLCCSTMCCKCFYAVTPGSVNWAKYEAEAFEITYDGKAVGTVRVVVGFAAGGGFGRQTQAFLAEAWAPSTPLWTLNGPVSQADGVPKDKPLKYHCFTCTNMCDCLTPCCCPVCLPVCGCNFKLSKLCGAICCPGCSRCFRCCDGCCNFCVRCPMWCCRPCCACCQVCKTRQCCGTFQGSQTVISTGARGFSTDSMHKLHRVIYPLKASDASSLYGWAAFTQVEQPGCAKRASLALKGKPSASRTHELLALPLLLDLAFGTEDLDRDSWTLAGSPLFEPTDVVNLWPEGVKLRTVLHSFDPAVLKHCPAGKAQLPPAQETM